MTALIIAIEEATAKVLPAAVTPMAIFSMFVSPPEPVGFSRKGVVGGGVETANVVEGTDAVEVIAVVAGAVDTGIFTATKGQPLSVVPPLPSGEGLIKDELSPEPLIGSIEGAG